MEGGHANKTGRQTMSRLNRRNWLKRSTAAVGGFWLGTNAISARTTSANETLDLAFIGVGGRGHANLKGLRNQNLIAFCDVDGQRAKNAFEQFPSVPRFVDFRKMLDKLENKLDGVVISTPDHTHFHPAFQALQMGKHVYLEKPMAHNVWETRTLCDLARKQKVATQLGVQRHTLANMHRVVELVQAGAIGDVSEVYCWIGGKRGMPGQPKDTPPVPDHLNYDLWIGPAKKHDYHPSITPYGWRFWWDYGTGETGNWGCHILDIPFWALGLKHPTKVTGKGPKVDKHRTPKSMQTTFEFAATKDRPKVKLHWDHLDQGPEILRQHGLPHKGNNTLFIGSEGMLLAGFGKHELLPAEKFKDFTRPDRSIPDSPGFYQEWITACKGGQAATCNFEYSGPLAETVMLGNLAYRTQSSFAWDHKSLTTDSETANQFLKEDYREGWQI